jgi:gluconolactonase
MAAYKIEIVESSPRSVLGEGPHWDIERQCLYYIDIYGTSQSISRYDYNEKKTYNAVIPGYPVVSFIIPVDGTSDQFLIGVGKKLLVIQWDGKSGEAKPLNIVAEVESDMPENRFNDAKCDPAGRFYGGTMRIGLLNFLSKIILISLQFFYYFCSRDL